MKVLIVDDHEIVRDGLATLLKDSFSIDSILFASEGREAIQKATNHSIDLVLMDLSMPNGLDGLSSLRDIRKLIPKGKIIIFSMYEEIEYQKKAFELGADGFLIKHLKTDDIIHSIKQILQGKRIANNQLFDEEVRTEAWVNPFTPREQETFILTIKGYSQEDIAKTMSISIRTVENHRRSISKKLGTTNKRSWMEFAHKHKMIEI